MFFVALFGETPEKAEVSLIAKSQPRGVFLMSNFIRSKMVLFSVLVCAITLLILALIPARVWDDLIPATCLDTGCFCEVVIAENPIRQPSNTVSSLAFAVVGIWVLLQARATSENMPFTYPHRVMFGISAVMIGVGSAFYHASMTFIGQFFDIFGMYLLTGLMWVYALQRIGNWTTRRAALAYFLLNVALTILQLSLPETRRVVFALLLLLALISEGWLWSRTRPPRNYRWFWGGLLTFGAAYTVWLLDDSGVWCDPTSWLQGHAIWHIFGASAVYGLWRWYISEENGK